MAIGLKEITFRGYEEYVYALSKLKPITMGSLISGLKKLKNIEFSHSLVYALSEGFSFSTKAEKLNKRLYNMPLGGFLSSIHKEYLFLEEAVINDDDLLVIFDSRHKRFLERVELYKQAYNLELYFGLESYIRGIVNKNATQYVHHVNSPLPH